MLDLLRAQTRKKMEVYEMKGEEYEDEMEPEMSYPTICLSDKQLPVVKDWKVGEEYEVVVKLRQTGMQEEGEDGIHADFKIMSIAVPKV